MARILRQNIRDRLTFTAKMAAKQAAAREAALQRAARVVPRWLQGLVLPLIRWYWDRRQRQFTRQGHRGEHQLTTALRFRLGTGWRLIPDVVLSLASGDCAQVDHLILGPRGLYVIEVKTWHGAVQAGRDRWVRKQGGRWVPVENPVRQNVGHVRKLRRWLAEHQLEDLDGRIQAAVVVLETAWLRVRDVPMPVFDRPNRLVRWLKAADARLPEPPDGWADRVLAALGIPSVAD